MVAAVHFDPSQSLRLAYWTAPATGEVEDVPDLEHLVRTDAAALQAMTIVRKGERVAPPASSLDRLGWGLFIGSSGDAAWDAASRAVRSTPYTIK